MSANVTHIGVLVHDLDAAAKFWTETFGFREIHRMEIKEESVNVVMLATPNALGIELIQPVDKNDMQNPVARKLAEDGEGFFHLAMRVDHIGDTKASLSARHLKVMERPPAAIGSFFDGIVDSSATRLIVHPKSANGVFIELLQNA